MEPPPPTPPTTTDDIPSIPTDDGSRKFDGEGAGLVVEEECHLLDLQELESAITTHVAINPEVIEQEGWWV